jgi:hypothetical protein
MPFARLTDRISEALTFDSNFDAYFSAERRAVGEAPDGFTIVESTLIGDFVFGRAGPRVELCEPRKIYRLMVGPLYVAAI